MFYVAAKEFIDHEKMDIEFTIREIATNIHIVKQSHFYSGSEANYIPVTIQGALKYAP
ncbi:hypothetical protein ACM9HF_06340 [Colwellia sp. RE-S-Sl-9]